MEHPAVRRIQVGRGYGIYSCPVIDLGIGSTGKTWHILVPGEEYAGSVKPVCGSRASVSAQIEMNIDGNVISFQRRPVCGRCRSLVGTVPLPTALRTPPSTKEDQ